MATNTLGTFCQTVLDGTMQTVYTVQPGHALIPKTLTFCAFGTAASATVSVYFVASGDTPGDKNVVVLEKLVVRKETVMFNPDMFLQAGFTIQVKASVANMLNCQVSGVDQG